jgi:ribonuclease P protein component
MKRTVREIFRRNRDAFPAMDVVVHIRPGAAGLPFTALRRDLLDAIRRARRRLETRRP